MENKINFLDIPFIRRIISETKRFDRHDLPKFQPSHGRLFYEDGTYAEYSLRGNKFSYSNSNRMSSGLNLTITETGDVLFTEIEVEQNWNLPYSIESELDNLKNAFEQSHHIKDRLTRVHVKGELFWRIGGLWSFGNLSKSVQLNMNNDMDRTVFLAGMYRFWNPIKKDVILTPEYWSSLSMFLRFKYLETIERSRDINLTPVEIERLITIIEPFKTKADKILLNKLSNVQSLRYLNKQHRMSED